MNGRKIVIRAYGVNFFCSSPPQQTRDRDGRKESDTSQRTNRRSVRHPRLHLESRQCASYLVLKYGDFDFTSMYLYVRECVRACVQASQCHISRAPYPSSFPRRPILHVFTIRQSVLSRLAFSIPFNPTCQSTLLPPPSTSPCQPMNDTLIGRCWANENREKNQQSFWNSGEMKILKYEFCTFFTVPIFKVSIIINEDLELIFLTGEH